MRSAWRHFDEHLDWISCWDHLYEAPPAGGTLDHFEALTVLGALAASTERAQIGCLVLCADAEIGKLKAEWAPAFDRVVGGGLIGTPDDAIERIRAYKAAEAQGINIALRAPWDCDALDAYLHEVVPEARKL